MHVALLVHSHGVYRAGLKLLLAYELDMRVVEAADTRAALLHLGQQQIDILILDAELLDTDGLQLIRHTKNYCSHLPVLVLSTEKHRQAAAKAQKLGAFVVRQHSDKYDFSTAIHSFLSLISPK